MSASIESAMPGYWTLMATSRPSWVTPRYTCPMLAAAAGTGSIRREHAVRILAPFGRQDLAHLLPVDRAHVVTQRCESFLDVGRLLLVETGDLDRREHLAGLHRGAAQDGELIDERVDSGDDPVAAAPTPVILAPACIKAIADPSGGATHRHAAESRGSRGARTAGESVIWRRHVASTKCREISASRV